MEMKKLSSRRCVGRTYWWSVGTASAQTYPSRPVTMIVPFAAGGPMDVVARVVAEGMRPSLGQAIVIENVVGAGGSIGAGRLARATPDGFTISYGGWPTHVINGAHIFPFLRSAQRFRAGLADRERSLDDPGQEWHAGTTTLRI